MNMPSCKSEPGVEGGHSREAGPICCRVSPGRQEHMVHSVLCRDGLCSLLGTARRLYGICGAVLCLPVEFSSDMAGGHCCFTNSSLPTVKQKIA